MPALKKGTVRIKFKVLKDGTISDVQYAAHSGDDGLDQAAYEGIASSSPLPALPSDFGCRFVALRIRFQYNPGLGEAADDSSKTAGLIPCVTSEIQFVGQISISLTPSSSQVSIGRNLQLLTTVTGLEDPKIRWKVAGAGCAAEECGKISSGGLYRAPLSIPNPPTIIVTATLENGADESASTTVTIVPPTSAQ
jgi:TonB family protein